MILDPILDLLRGQAVTIPPMDGALKPNTLLDQCEVLREVTVPDNLVALGNDILFSSGREVLTLAGVSFATCEADVTALAASPDGTLAIALDTGRIELRGGETKAIDGFNCVTAMNFGGGDGLYVCNGSAEVPVSGWSGDLMRKNAMGSLWRVAIGSGARAQLASGLAWPNGVAIDAANGQVLVSESWRHRVVAIPAGGGASQPILDRLPGYPARIAAAPGGYLMPLFAPRNRLIEFVLREDAYREDMMREIDPQFWIAPSLSPSRSFLEPLQNGSVRTMGIHKPWSPSRSYGLVVALNDRLRPIASFHSRANGTRHGVTSAIARDGAIIAAAKGGNCILRIAATAGETP